MLYSNAVTDCHARLATGGWLTLARLDSHQLDYSPFVWAHNPDLSVSFLLHIRDLNIVPQLVEHLHEGLVHDAIMPNDLRFARDLA